jgi:hypothetical protein
LSEAERTIFLINQVSGHGHLDLYARLYSACLLEIGYRVVLIEQHDSGTQQWLDFVKSPRRKDFISFTRDGLRKIDRPTQFAEKVEPGAPCSDDLSPLPPLSRETSHNGQRAQSRPVVRGLGANEADGPSPTIPPLISRMRNVWRKEGARGVAVRLYNRAISPIREMLRIFDIEVPRLRTGFGGEFSLIYVVAARAISKARGVARGFARLIYREWIRPTLNRFVNQDLYLSGFDFRAIVDEVHLAQLRLGTKPDLVFFLYLDMMNENRDGCRYLEQNLGAPWAGILFHPRYTRLDDSRTEKYFHCGNARGAAFLNPHFLPAYRKRFPQQVFCEVPDISEGTLPIVPSSLAKRLRERAGDRKIVLLLGSIGAHKGVLDLLEAVRTADPKRFVFAIVGEVFWHNFGDKEAELRAVYQAPPENLFLSEGYLKEESELNAIIAASDIVFSVYRNFRDSSNSLTKVSLLEKPILVSDDYLMGERVRRYRIGATVKPGSIEEIVSAIDKLSRKSAAEFGFAQFRQDQSVENLKKVLAENLPLWMAEQ